MDFDSPATTPVKDQALLDFVKHCKSKIGYTKPAKIRIFDDHEFTKKLRSMACYIPERDEIWVLRGYRVRADWYRSLAHELVHAGQREKGSVDLTGEDGHESENEANSLAGVILREYGRKDPSIYAVESLPTKVSETVSKDNLLEWTYYKEYNIHAVNQMINLGILKVDYDNFNTYPEYLKRFRWMEIDVGEARGAAKADKYEKAIDSLVNLTKYANGMIKALEIAIEDQKAGLPSTAQSDQPAGTEPEGTVLPSTADPGAG